MAEHTIERSVRHPVWQGVQQAAGLWFPAEWLAPATREARMLAAWQPGCRAYRFEMGDMLRFARPRTIVCEHASGQVLCICRDGLCSAPLTEQELLALPAFDIAVVAGGSVQGLRFDQAALLDLSMAIGISEYALHEPYDFRPARLAFKLPQLEGKNVRSLLHDVIPPQSEDSKAFLLRLREGRATQRGERSSSFVHGRSSIREALFGIASTMLFKLMPSLAATTQEERVGLQPRQRPGKPSAWREKLARLAVASRVGKLIGYQQGAYLRRMMEMFEQGNLDEALRNALPLDGLGQSLGQAFSAPNRRSSLQVSGRIGAVSSINLGDDLQQHLRRLYRTSFEKLDRQGRIDEALFVLAELLNARQEAIDYLVKHGRHAQAAELALGWDLPAGMIIRLLMLAGDTNRAVLVARRDSAFSEAIQQLQPSHSALADSLRLEWGRALVDAGDWLRAVDVVWPLPHAREQAGQWLLAAERAGACLSARALVQRAVLLPDTVERYEAQIEELADPTLHEDARTAMAEALLASKSTTSALRSLAARVLPAIAADRAAGRNDLSAASLDRILKLSDDPYLRADVPAWRVEKAAGTGLWQRSTPMHAQAPAAGLHRIHDAAILPDRRYVVALGEAGVAVLDALGQTQQRYAVPAFKLVLADSGQVALAIAPRERVSRIARLDLVNNAILDLGAMAIQFAAPSCNGIGWTVVCDNRILVIDSSRPSRDVLWHVGDLPGPIVAAGFFQHCEAYLVRGPDGLQDWTYKLPERRLQARKELLVVEELPKVMHPAGSVLQPQVRIVAGSHVEVCYHWGTQERTCVLGNGVPEDEFHCTFIAISSGLLVGLHQTTGSRYFVIRVADGFNVATVAWPAGALAYVREQVGHLLFHDDAGRLLDLAIETSATRHLSIL